MDDSQKNKIRKVAALSTSPHEGEAYKAMRLSVKLLADNGGPEDFTALIELALTGIRPTTTTSSPPPRTEQARSSDVYDKYTNKSKNSQTRYNTTRIDLSQAFFGIMQSLSATNSQDGIVNIYMVKILRAIAIYKPPADKRLVNIQKALANAINSSAWSFIADLDDRGYMYCTHLSDKQYNWLRNSFERVITSYIILWPMHISTPWSWPETKDGVDYIKMFDSGVLSILPQPHRITLSEIIDKVRMSE